MSDPAIGIGHPVSDPAPSPDHPEICFGIIPRGPLISWCGIPGFPYAIRNSEFGIPESGIGNREMRKSGKSWRGLTHLKRTPVNIGPNAVHRFLHLSKDSPLTMWIMVR